MRDMWQDKTVHDTTSQLNALAVNWVNIAHLDKRDFWIRAWSLAGGSALTIDILKTREEANASTYDASGRIAYLDSPLLAPGQGLAQTIWMTDDAGNLPDYGQLGIEAMPEGLYPEDHVEVWGYVSALGEIVADEVYDILAEYFSEGRALEDFSEKRMKRGPDFWTRHNGILVGWAGDEMRPEPSHQHGRDVMFTVEVSVSGIPGGTFDPWRQLMRYASAIASILGDEQRRLPSSGASIIQIPTIGAPYEKRPESGPVLLACELTGVVAFPAIASDA